MITSKDFPRLIYRKPKLKFRQTRIDNVLGLDSEAYITGRPFMICLSDGTIIDPKNAIDHLVNNYLRHNFMLYNMRYDSGAILYSIPRCVMHLLWETGEVEYKKYTLSYIAHKYLDISIDREKVRFWDVAQYYKGMSLDRAAQTYLNKSKQEMETKSFTKDFVNKNHDRIAKYCIHDADLARELGEHLFDKLDTFGLVPSKIYSSASISFQYYTEKSKYVTVWRLYNNQRKIDALKYACDAYRGGKFEISARGAFTGHEYDITSAYPFFVSSLVDINRARVVYSNKYEKDAVYGFLRVCLRSDGRPFPCGIKYQKSETMVYPSGELYITITKIEYDWLVAHNFDVTLYGGWWFFVRSIRYPYRDITHYLFSIKDEYKKKDRTLYGVIKVILNGIYGKMAQCIEKHDDTVSAGAGWNPVYAAYITAQTRIMVTDVQYNLGSECLAVHTDSVILKNRHDSLIKPGLGGFEYVTGGGGILVACGMYELADEHRFKGFKPPRGETWKNILTKMGNCQTMAYPYTKVESWYEAMAKGHTKNRINLFHKDVKKIDLNCDIKRAWKNRATGESLLSGLEYAPPIHIVQKKGEDFT